MKYKLILLFSMATLALHAQSRLAIGKWRIVLQLNDSTELPFNIEVKEDGIDILNAKERITMDQIGYREDSVIMKLPVFDSEIRASFTADKMSGGFYNYARREKRIIPLKGERAEFRFRDLSAPASIDLTGRWEVFFTDDKPPLNISVGEFQQHDNYLTGTFLTSTGDYRYLEGAVRGNEFWLSGFDGFHCFLFHGTGSNDGVLNGDYYSGRHWHDTWAARRNEKAALPDPYSLTFLKPGFDKFEFAFPDVDSNVVSLKDNKFQKKVVIVQLMGTWCPNCMDETAFLAPFYKKYKSKGVEIIALDFERTDDFAKVKTNLQRLKERYDIDYTMLYAGSNDLKLRAKALPMLNDIISVPTTIFIDRNNKVRKIHTGFSGPATGDHYEKWKEDFYLFVDKLLREK